MKKLAGRVEVGWFDPVERGSALLAPVRWCSPEIANGKSDMSARRRGVTREAGWLGISVCIPAWALLTGSLGKAMI